VAFPRLVGLVLRLVIADLPTSHMLIEDKGDDWSDNGSNQQHAVGPHCDDGSS